VEETVEILRESKRTTKATTMSLYPASLEAASTLSRRYITERYLPDKAIDLIDESGSRKRIKNSIRPKELADLEREIDRLNAEKAPGQHPELRERRPRKDTVRQLKGKVDEIKKSWESR